MTLDVQQQQRPATSCGKASHSGVAISTSALTKKKKLVRAISSKADDIPEQSDDDGDPNACRLPAKKPSKCRDPESVAAALKRFEQRAGDKTLQLTNMLRSETAKLSQQLLIASEKGNKHAAYLLLHHGIDRDRCRGMSGYSPLHYAATRGHLEVIQLLLDFGWDINAANDLLETPLHLAAYNGHAPIVECLLDRGASVNALNSDDETPLFYAARKSHYRIVRLLIRRECNLALKNKFGDVAEDEASHEKTQLEFSVGKEDAQRLYSMKPTHSSQVLRRDAMDKNTQATPGSSEQSISQKQREHILSFLDLKSLCLSSQVSYRWHRAADSPSLWRRLGVSRWELLLNATMGIGTVSPMSFMNRSSGFHLDLSTSSSSASHRRPSSCDQGNSRFMAPSVKRKSAIQVHRGDDEQRPQTARLCGAAGF